MTQESYLSRQKIEKRLSNRRQAKKKPPESEIGQKEVSKLEISPKEVSKFEISQKEAPKFEIGQKDIHKTGDLIAREAKGFELREANIKNSEEITEMDLPNDANKNHELKGLMLKAQNKKSMEDLNLHTSESKFENRINRMKENRRKLSKIGNLNDSPDSRSTIDKKDVQASDNFRNTHDLYFSNTSKNINQNTLKNDMSNLRENLSGKINYGVQNHTTGSSVKNTGFQKLVENPFFKGQMNEQFQRMLNRAKILIKDQKNASLTTNLHPKELGKVSLKLSLLDGSLNGYFTVDNDVVQKLLMEKIDKILEELKQDGYKVSNFQVNVKSDDSSKESSTKSGKRTPFFSNDAGHLDDSQETNTQTEAKIYA